MNTPPQSVSGVWRELMISPLGGLSHSSGGTRGNIWFFSLLTLMYRHTFSEVGFPFACEHSLKSWQDPRGPRGHLY